MCRQSYLLECAMFDKDTKRLVGIFQEVFNRDDCEPDQAKYVKRHASFIENTGQLFEYLSWLSQMRKARSVGGRRLF